eukprot:366551-Chlamydomonas_euryale.AAC.40
MFLQPDDTYPKLACMQRRSAAGPHAHAASRIKRFGNSMRCTSRFITEGSVNRLGNSTSTSVRDGSVDPADKEHDLTCNYIDAMCHRMKQRLMAGKLHAPDIVQGAMSENLKATFFFSKQHQQGMLMISYSRQNLRAWAQTAPLIFQSSNSKVLLFGTDFEWNIRTQHKICYISTSALAPTMLENQPQPPWTVDPRLLGVLKIKFVISNFDSKAAKKSP